jgi:hypothetical protein
MKRDDDFSSLDGYALTQIWRDHCLPPSPSLVCEKRCRAVGLPHRGLFSPCIGHGEGET